MERMYTAYMKKACSDNSTRASPHAPPPASPKAFHHIAQVWPVYTFTSQTHAGMSNCRKRTLHMKSRGLLDQARPKGEGDSKGGQAAKAECAELAIHHSPLALHFAH